MYRRYCFGMEIPASVMRSDAMIDLWDHTNAVISMLVHEGRPFQLTDRRLKDIDQHE